MIRGCGALLVMAANLLLAQTLPLNHPAIGYGSIAFSDPVAKLSRSIEQGKIRLDFDPVTGYLPAALKALGVPVESQMAVFSKTSVQSMRIEPTNPRILFFNDQVIVGWVRGGFVELASQDPRLGLVFYQLDQRPEDYKRRAGSATPESPFARRNDCLQCHMTSATLGVPGVLLRSVFPSISGAPLVHAPQYDTDNRLAFDKLWGGWYVTGNSGDGHHMGNLIAADEEHPESMLRMSPAHLDTLEGKCLPNSRLTPYSDVVALMVFEHQVRMMNLITRAGWETRVALADSHSITTRARSALNDLADYMLFVDEAPLTGEISGTSGFTEVFAATGPRDHQGRSLRELSLKGRLMRYPCSYMIYSEAFDALPFEAKDAVYRRMRKILRGRDSADRRAVIEILRDTKKDWPASFGTASASESVG